MAAVLGAGLAAILGFFAWRAADGVSSPPVVVFLFLGLAGGAVHCLLRCAGGGDSDRALWCEVVCSDSDVLLKHSE